MNRPYSLKELKDLEKDLLKKHRLSDNFVVHIPCMHKYRVKKGGRKEQYIIENGSILDNQTCSVCFKIRTSDEIPEIICEVDDELSVKYINNLNNFYKWLYLHSYN
jgi:hypothetical protein